MAIVVQAVAHNIPTEQLVFGSYEDSEGNYYMPVTVSLDSTDNIIKKIGTRSGSAGQHQTSRVCSALLHLNHVITPLLLSQKNPWLSLNE